MANEHLKGTGSYVDVADARQAASHGNARLALFYICRYHGGPLADLWKFVALEKQTDDPPGTIVVSSGLPRKE